MSDDILDLDDRIVDQHARDEAARAVRVTLDQLGPAIAIEMASAAVPLAGDIATDSSLGTAVAGRYVAYIAAHAADHATPESRLPPGSTGFSEERRRQADELARALEVY